MAFQFSGEWQILCILHYFSPINFNYVKDLKGNQESLILQATQQPARCTWVVPCSKFREVL